MCNDDGIELTLGQTAVREHVYALAQTHPTDSPPEWSLVEELQTRLENDPRVTSDKVTGKRLDLWPAPQSLLGLLGAWPGHTTEITTPSVLSINDFQYGPQDLVVGQKAFTLGRKPHTTAYALLGLATGVQLPTQGWDLHVYEEVGAITTSSGGNHRSLACLLWGQPRVPLRQVHWTRPTGLATSRILEALAFYESLGLSTSWIHTSDSLAEFLQIFDATTFEQRIRLGSYFRRLNRDWRSVRDQLAELRRALEGLNAMVRHEQKGFAFDFLRRRARADLLKNHPILQSLDAIGQ